MVNVEAHAIHCRVASTRDTILWFVARDEYTCVGSYSGIELLFLRVAA